MNKKIRQQERRVFKLSPLEIFLLAVAVIGLAFMVRTIFSSPQERSARMEPLLSSLEQRVGRLESLLEQKIRALTQGQVREKSQGKKLEARLQRLEARLAKLERMEVRLKKLEKERRELDQSLEKAADRVEKRISSLAASLKKRISALESKSTVSAVPPSAPSKAVQPKPQPKPSPVVYKVKKGDTGYGIARKFGVTYKQLCKWNQLDPKVPLKIGQRLTIYVAGSR